MSLTLQKALGELDSKISGFADIIRRQNGLIPGVQPSKSRDHTESKLYAQVVSTIQVSCSLERSFGFDFSSCNEKASMLNSVHNWIGEIVCRLADMLFKMICTI